MKSQPWPTVMKQDHIERCIESRLLYYSEHRYYITVSLYTWATSMSIIRTTISNHSSSILPFNDTIGGNIYACTLVVLTWHPARPADESQPETAHVDRISPLLRPVTWLIASEYIWIYIFKLSMNQPLAQCRSTHNAKFIYNIKQKWVILTDFVDWELREQLGVQRQIMRMCMINCTYLWV